MKNQLRLQIGNAPCSWGVIESVKGQRAGYAQVLNEMEAAGYAGTELGDWGFMSTGPDRLRRELAARHLQLLGSWVSVYLHDAGRHAESAADAVRTARLLAEVGGPENIIILGNDPFGDRLRRQNAGRIKPQHGLSETQWQILAEGAERVAREVKRETGLRTVFHHHIATWVETPEETAHLLRLTDPATLGLCFDTGHYRFGGGDPMAGLERYADRIWHVHFKDHAPHVADQSRRQSWDATQSVEHGIFCELGQGDVDFPSILAKLKELRYEGWIVVEQDVLPGMGSPQESAQRNRDYLRSIGL